MHYLGWHRAHLITKSPSVRNVLDQKVRPLLKNANYVYLYRNNRRSVKVTVKAKTRGSLPRARRAGIRLRMGNIIETTAFLTYI